MIKTQILNEQLISDKKAEIKYSSPQNKKGIQDYSTNSLRDFPSNERLPKISDKSFVKSFEIEKIAHLLEQMRRNEGESPQFIAGHQDGVGCPGARGYGEGTARPCSVLRRSRSLTTRQYELFRIMKLARKTALLSNKPNSSGDLHLSQHTLESQLNDLCTQELITTTLSGRLKVWDNHTI